MLLTSRYKYANYYAKNGKTTRAFQKAEYKINHAEGVKF